MSEQNSGGSEGGNKGGGRKRKRYIRNRRRNRRPQGQKPDSSGEENSGNSGGGNSGGGGSSRGRSNRRSSARSKGRGGDEATLDPVKRARRDRRRRKRSGGRGGDREGNGSAIVAPVEPMPDLEIEPKRVFVYTHVARPSLRDAYEYRAEHFTQTGRKLEDFQIDLSSILQYPDDDPEGEPVINLRIGGTGELGEDADWDDDEPLDDDAEIAVS